MRNTQTKLSEWLCDKLFTHKPVGHNPRLEGHLQQRGDDDAILGIIIIITLRLIDPNNTPYYCYIFYTWETIDTTTQGLYHSYSPLTVKGEKDRTSSFRTKPTVEVAVPSVTVDSFRTLIHSLPIITIHLRPKSRIRSHGHGSRRQWRWPWP